MDKKIEELVEKCLLTEKRVNEIVIEEGISTLSGLVYGIPKPILRAQILEAIPIIKQARDMDWIKALMRKGALVSQPEDILKLSEDIGKPEEAIRKTERERIIELIEDWRYIPAFTTQQENFNIILDKLTQALQEEK